MARTQHIAAAAKTFADRLWGGNGINLIDPKLEMHQVVCQVVESDETVLRIEKLAD